MKSKSVKYAWVVFSVIVLWSLFEIFYYYPQLPSLMATHFDASGYPDSFMDKQSFILVFAALLLIIVISFGLVAYFFPQLLEISNIPNKDFWLMEENRDYAFRILIVNYLSLGTLTLIFFSYIFYTVARFNILSLSRTGSIWPPLIIYLLLTTLIVANLLRNFGKKAVEKHRKNRS